MILSIIGRSVIVSPMKSRLSLAAALGTSAALAGALLLAGRHELARSRRAIDGGYSQFVVALRAREEVIPQIVTMTKAYASQEQSVFDEIASAHAAMLAARTPAETMAADAALQVALARMLLLQDVHPEVKSDPAFPRLQSSLRDAESRVFATKRKYNEQVQQYDAAIAVFPQNAAAALFGFHREENFFKADALLR
jgi:LemA protein